MQKENKLYLGDCLDILPQIETDSIDAIVTDPPYGLKFMNNKREQTSEHRGDKFVGTNKQTALASLLIIR
jgi:site-specific DNA-methyltransferase (adenine-specific)